MVISPSKITIRHYGFTHLVPFQSPRCVSRTEAALNPQHGWMTNNGSPCLTARYWIRSLQTVSFWNLLPTDLAVVLSASVLFAFFPNLQHSFADGFQSIPTTAKNSFKRDRGNFIEDDRLAINHRLDIRFVWIRLKMRFDIDSRDRSLSVKAKNKCGPRIV